MKTPQAHPSLPFSASRCWVRMGKLLEALYRLYEREPAAAVASLPDTRHLPDRSLLRLGKASNVSSIQVRRGAVWLTRTPAEADVILKAGDRLDLGHGWPIVVQALQDSQVDLWSSERTVR